ncbi:uncharacterized protein RSE6_11764 [Rhynchosporium secalis]|uniref:Extradiol ring-cleavage dioxygenase class III enzyme subunit B domain-containing protein n=1 Tax=Rhynchosporium secalis TaxID=38038 RepID=A0A1E1MNQ6_RHYSE|nr:uncharacterized protein RSE6_11764 [Rhynchosporium secalis]
MTTRAPVVAVCHGGGPMPVLGDPGHAELIMSMSTKVPKILNLGTRQAPRAIVLVTAHWSETQPTISNGKTHKLYYDYGGFPAEAYRLKYPAPGSPKVAEEVFNVLKGAGFQPKLDGERGWDHGVFIPLLLINPKADIPVIQLSVMNSASPKQHFEMGKALAQLRDSNIAILGSGMPTMHNLRAMFSAQGNESNYRKRIQKWSDMLTKTTKIVDVEERSKTFEGYREWEGSREAHPIGGEEHFLPLVVCAGAGGEGEAGAFGDEMVGFKQFTYYWN